MSRFYGFPVFDLPGPVRAKMETAMVRLAAEDRLAAGCGDKEVYDLVLAATGGDEAAASAAYAARLESRLAAGETPDV